MYGWSKFIIIGKIAETASPAGNWDAFIIARFPIYQTGRN
jgi:hypothetical protein